MEAFEPFPVDQQIHVHGQPAQAVGVERDRPGDRVGNTGLIESRDELAQGREDEPFPAEMAVAFVHGILAIAVHAFFEGGRGEGRHDSPGWLGGPAAPPSGCRA